MNQVFGNFIHHLFLKFFDELLHLIGKCFEMKVKAAYPELICVL